MLGIWGLSRFLRAAKPASFDGVLSSVSFMLNDGSRTSMPLTRSLETKNELRKHIQRRRCRASKTGSYSSHRASSMLIYRLESRVTGNLKVTTHEASDVAAIWFRDRSPLSRGPQPYGLPFETRWSPDSRSTSGMRYRKDVSAKKLRCSVTGTHIIAHLPSPL